MRVVGGKTPDRTRGTAATARRSLAAENRGLRQALETLRAGRALLGCLDFERLQPLVLETALRVLGRRRGIAVFPPPRAGLELRGFEPDETALLRAGALQRAGSPPLGARRPRVLASGPMWDGLRTAGVPVREALVAPVGSGGSAAVLWIVAEEGTPAFGRDDIERLALLATEAALALGNAARHRAVREAALRDPVTGLYNVRHLTTALERELKRGERSGRPWSLLFLDVDGFKALNDRHGHRTGSSVLRQIARVLERTVRGIDTVARAGGDEFAVLLVEADAPTARRIAERIRVTLERRRWPRGLRLTVSIGVATYAADGARPGELVERADLAMYRAKALGRNRVCSAAVPGEAVLRASPRRPPAGSPPPRTGGPARAPHAGR